jgi:hypothetical protein
MLKRILGGIAALAISEFYNSNNKMHNILFTLFIFVALYSCFSGKNNANQAPFAMDLYAKKSADEISVNERLSYPVPYLQCLFGRGDELYFIYLYHAIYRLCSCDLPEKTYIDRMIGFLPIQAVNFSDNILYACNFPHDLHIYTIPAFTEFMSGVKYDLAPVAELDDHFENPIIVEQILK